jgi:hypothetical protein
MAGYAPRATPFVPSLALIRPAGGRSLERLDRPPDPHPQEPAVIIAAIKHQIGALRRFKLGVGSVIADRATCGWPLQAWAQAIIK